MTMTTMRPKNRPPAKNLARRVQPPSYAAKDIPTRNASLVNRGAKILNGAYVANAKTEQPETSNLV